MKNCLYQTGLWPAMSEKIVIVDECCGRTQPTVTHTTSKVGLALCEEVT